MPDRPDRVDYDLAMAVRYSRTRGLSAVTRAQWIDLLQEATDTLNVSAVADVGCGVGRFLPVLHQAFPGAALVGVEPSDGMRVIAETECPPNCRVVAGALPMLPIPDCELDLVFISMVLQHCEDACEALRECARVCKPGGVIAVRTGTKETVRAFEFLQFYPPALERELAVMPSIRELRGWITSAGLTEIALNEVNQRIWESYGDYERRVLAGGFPSFGFLTDAERHEGDRQFRCYCRDRESAGEVPTGEPVVLLTAGKRDER